MRKLIVSSFLSLDGIIEKPWEWIGSYFDVEGSKKFALSKLAEVDFFLLGRKTYEIFSATWPNIKGDEYFDKMNNLPKLVASTTLQEATWKAKIIKGDVVKEITKLKQEPGKDILKYGVGQLDYTLLQHNLIDELQFSIIPISVGSGRHLFEGVDTSQFKFNLINTKKFDNGVVSLIYTPKLS